MEICSIVPVNHAEWMYKEPIVMCLTHLVEKYPEYARLARESKNYKILDNSLIELKDAVSIERVIKSAEIINADEIILPDEFQNADETIRKTEEAIQWLKENNYLGKYKLQAVVHGNTKEAFIKCFNALNNMPEIDVISIPKVTSTYSWCPNRSRGELFHLYKNTNKILHFLGSWYNLDEILSISNRVWDRVRSCDTCLPSLYAIQNKHVWEDREGTIDLEKDYEELNESNYKRVLNEIDQMMERRQKR